MNSIHLRNSIIGAIALCVVTGSGRALWKHELHKQIPFAPILTNYIVVPGAEDTFGSTLPIGYVLISNGSTWGFMDGDKVMHPACVSNLNEDDGYSSALDAIKAAWRSHTRRLRIRAGLQTNAVWYVMTNSL